MSATIPSQNRVRSAVSIGSIMRASRSRAPTAVWSSGSRTGCSRIIGLSAISRVKGQKRRRRGGRRCFGLMEYDTEEGGGLFSYFVNQPAFGQLLPLHELRATSCQGHSDGGGRM